MNFFGAGRREIVPFSDFVLKPKTSLLTSATRESLRAGAKEFRACVLSFVSDFKLASGTALSFVQWLRSEPRFGDIPVVMLSGVASQMDPALFVGLTVNSFLRKTSDVIALGATLQPLLP